MADVVEKRSLQEWREARQLTQLGLADKARVSITTVIGIETRNKRPNLTTAEKLADALDVTILDILWPKPTKSSSEGE